MARPLRIEQPGGWYHITARGNERKAIYRDDRDREHFCDLLAEMVSRYGVRLHCFVLMDNHYHLLLELSEANLSRALQWLNVSYSVWFNRRHHRSGHLLQGRFQSVAVSREEWGLELSRYVHLNPVRLGRLGLTKADRQRSRAGAVSRPEARRVQARMDRLRAFRWSSYRAYAGLAKAPEWLECESILDLGGGKGRARQANYREHVEQAVREGLERSPWEEVKEQVVLGGERFLHRIRQSVKGDVGEQRSAKRLAARRVELEQVIACVEKVKGAKWADFRERHGDSGRELVMYLGRRACGLKLAELARAVGVKEYAAVGMALTRYEKRLRKDRSLEKEFRQASKMLKIKI